MRRGEEGEGGVRGGEGRLQKVLGGDGVGAVLRGSE